LSQDKIVDSFYPCPTAEAGQTVSEKRGIYNGWSLVQANLFTPLFDFLWEEPAHDLRLPRRENAWR
jgi:hypothetical protein